jgi:hypothetical protein
MKQFTGVVIIYFLMACVGVRTQAANGNSNATGYWNNPSTWLFNGNPQVPNCGDTINILSGFTVTVNQQNDYSGCGNAMIVHVYGTLGFTNGNKLSLPCGSVVYIHPGGTVLKTTSGGGNSTLIEICGATLWSAGDGPITGPDTLQVNPLPITLLAFNAEPAENKIDVTWITASEINNDYFTVEKSADGTDFIPVSTVDGAGNSSATLRYAYNDYSPLFGTSYYRLKQIDFDGQYSYSQIVMVNYSGEYVFSIASVFVNENSLLNIFFTGDVKEKCRVEIFDMLGKNIYGVDLASAKGMNKKQIHIPSLTQGNYFVTLSNGRETVSRRFISR